MRKRAAKVTTPSPPPQTLYPNQTKNTGRKTVSIIHICLQKKTSGNIHRCGTKQCRAPLFSQRAKGYATAKTNQTAAEKEKTHWSRGEAGGRGGKGSHLAPAQRKIKAQKTISCTRAAAKDELTLQVEDGGVKLRGVASETLTTAVSL